MNEQLRELYNEYLNHSDAERVQTAQAATAVVAKFLNEAGLSNEQSFAFFMNIVRLFVSADRNCSEEEADLFNAVMGTSLSFEQFYNLTNGGADPEFVAFMDELIDSLPEEVKVDVCTFGLTILCADGNLTGAEQAFFEKILG